MRKKNQVLKTTKNIMVGGVGLMAGSVVMDKIAVTSASPSVVGIASTGQSALQIGAVAMPIGAAKGVIGSMDTLVKSTKRRKRK